jgi:hypothetical protein
MELTGFTKQVPASMDTAKWHLQQQIAMTEHFATARKLA